MKFKYHLLIGFVASFALVKFFNFSLVSGLVIFVASWIIDFDHYLWYGFSTKDWNPIHAIKWYIKSIPKWHKLSLKEKEKFKRGVFIFHGIEFLIILSIFSFIHEFFFWILIGVMIHMVADWIDLRMKGERLYNKIFPLYVISRNEGKKSLREL